MESLGEHYMECTTGAMTPADEATFIQRWQAGASYKALAQAFGCPLGTVASRAAALVAQGKITPRQRGGAYASRRAKARPEDPPVTPAPPAAERKDIQQWTVRLSKALIDHLKAVAYARRIPPSQLVDDWLWQQAHHERSPSTP
jgi:DNA-binding transcriptional MocR family regulator